MRKKHSFLVILKTDENLSPREFDAYCITCLIILILLEILDFIHMQNISSHK